MPKAKDLIRVEPYSDYMVLIYEDQPKPLTATQADKLLEQYPDVKEIHELHEVWGGRWTRKPKHKGMIRRKEVAHG